MGIMLEVKNISFSYISSNKVLEDISFDIDRGEIFSILGPNGSGKTTLLKCLNGILKPLSGRITLDKIDIFRLSVSDLAKHIAYVPQIHRPVFAYTVVDIVAMGRNPYIGSFSLPGKEDIDIAIDKLKLLDICHLRDRNYTDLSGGEMQLVMIARALTQEPEILLLDEPISHLDFRNQIRVMRMVKKLSHDNGIAIVMSMHDPNYSIIFSNRVMYLKNGRILGIDTPSRGIDKKNLENLYNTKIDMVPINGFNWIIPSHKMFV